MRKLNVHKFAATVSLRSNRGGAAHKDESGSLLWNLLRGLFFPEIKPQALKIQQWLFIYLAVGATDEQSIWKPSILRE